MLDPSLRHERTTLTKQIQASVPGMAHWAGTGPKGKYCGDCRFLVARKGAAGYGCDKYRQLMGRMLKNDIPRQTRACRHFEQR